MTEMGMQRLSGGEKHGRHQAQVIKKEIRDGRFLSRIVLYLNITELLLNTLILVPSLLLTTLVIGSNVTASVFLALLLGYSMYSVVHFARTPKNERSPLLSMLIILTFLLCTGTSLYLVVTSIKNISNLFRYGSKGKAEVALYSLFFLNIVALSLISTAVRVCLNGRRRRKIMERRGGVGVVVRVVEYVILPVVMVAAVAALIDLFFVGRINDGVKDRF